jgi:hypothetical protein
MELNLFSHAHYPFYRLIYNLIPVSQALMTDTFPRFDDAENATLRLRWGPLPCQPRAQRINIVRKAPISAQAGKMR